MSLPSVGAKERRVVILGLDGLDPKLLARWMDAGLLPHFARLREQGTFSPLATTNPPETAAAWAAFATGQNPGKTGIFDFVIRDPKTYAVMPGMVTLTRRKGGETGFKSAREGNPVWKLLGEQGLRATVLNLPVTWPPEPFNGQLLSGMGTPDLLGTMGVATCYGTDVGELRSRPRFRVREVKIKVHDGMVDTVLNGPQDQTIPLRFEIDAVARRATAIVQGKAVSFDEREWSDWCEVRFPLGEGEAFGLCRFCLLEVESELKIYCSPLQNHPRQPHVPISHPPTFARELYQALGPYRTQGREVDIFNLLEEVLEDDVLLDDTFRALEERERMTQHLLRHDASDLLISWFGVVDTTQHGYWRFIDPGHPLYTEEGHRRYGDAIQRVYQWLDGMVGRMLEEMGEGTVLLIASDHGCVNWRRSVHFNTWLWREGYLALKEGPEEQSDRPLPFSGRGGPAVAFSQVDWSRTRAYSIGCGKIYINLQGREGQGIVAPGAESEALQEELIARQLAWRDPATGGPVVRNVYRSREVQWGPYMDRAPDLIVGLHDGYRVSWGSMGQISLGEPVVDNTGKIGGDHISVDHELVPGSLLANVRFDLSDGLPHIMDITPTVLDLLGVPIPDDLDGQSLL